MSEGPRQPEESAIAPAASVPASTGAKRHVIAWRWVRRGALVVVALIAAILVSFFTVDLGRVSPWLKEEAERRASTYLERPMHIGRLSALVTPGTFALDDVVIEGRTPADRPFFKAKRIYVHVPWWTVLRRHIYVELQIDDFDMVVESWAGGRHNIPRLTRPRSGTSRPSRFPITTMTFARGGRFTYEDHATPWSVVAPNINFELVRAENLKRYVGKARFDKGTVQIQNYEPMQTSMSTRFVLDGSVVRLQHLDLVTDGSVSHINGDVDFGNWPRQTYNVNSTIDFVKMKQIFFKREGWRLAGEGQFTGQFKLFKEGGRELAGQFSSNTARINDLVFPNLHGALVWTQSRFDVTHAESGLLGGHTRFTYNLAPFGTPTGATARFAAEYVDTDLGEVTRALDLRGLHLLGVASGSLALEWRNGRFSETRRGDGHTFVTLPPGLVAAPRTLPSVPLPIVPEPVPFDGGRSAGPLAFAADVHYVIDPDGVTFDSSTAATPLTYVAFSGRMANAGQSDFPFHVTSHSWQESDWLLASIMTAVSGPTGAVEVSGRGTFDGKMTGTFSAPTIAGHFDSENTRVWDVTWGRAVADVVIAGGYVEITNGRVGDEPDSFITPNGRYALGFRKDDADEIAAHVELTNWPVVDLRHAFRLDDWPMDGTATSVTLDLTGRYRNMFGSGRMRIDRGTAWDERFDWATADLALEGTGMRIANIVMCKGNGATTCRGSAIDREAGDGVVRGQAHVGWRDSTYSFEVRGEGVPVEHLDNFKVARAPLSGRLAFEAKGEGPFESPAYEFTGSIPDLYAGDEGIGALTGRLSVKNNILSIDEMHVDSTRLDVSGAGTIALDGAYTSSLEFAVKRTLIDPYLKFVMSGDVSPYPQTVLGGRLTVNGPLATPEALTVDATIDDGTLTVFDYELKNDGVLRLTLDDGKLRIGAFRLRGADTNLELAGGADTRARTWNLTATGSASLSMLTLMRDFQTTTASGAANLKAAVTGSFDRPDFSGSAAITDGRLRPFDSPHGIEGLNGSILFKSDSISLSNFKGRIGNGGDVDFGGSIALDGYKFSTVSLTAQGRSLRLRYPEGFVSTVNMGLALTGTMQSLRLTGTVDVLKMTFIGQEDFGAGLFGLSTGGALAPITALPGAISESGTPLVLDIQIVAPRITFMDTSTLRVEGNANLNVLGTFTRPTLTGSVQIDGGQALLFGNRYYIRPGLIDFSDPDRLDPVFDIAAETRPRVNGQTFNINVRITGTFGRFTPTLTSDPWLPESDVYTLLFGGTADFQTAEQRSLRSSQELQQRFFLSAAGVLFASPFTSRVGQVLERTGLADTVQITPMLTSETTIQQSNATARVTLNRRISNRVFLTYSRTISGPQEEIILLEYDQNDRLSWVLSRNEDRSFALDFRIRYVF